MKAYQIAATALAIATMASCQKVIDVDLNSSDPQYIIEGNITDMPGPYSVKLSRSANFSERNNFPAVSGAVIAIQDVTAGIMDTLKEQLPGQYITLKISGVPGHTYSLYVKAGDKVFTATSTMPQPVMLDSVGIEKSYFGDNEYFPVPIYRDPTGEGNRYRVSGSVNHQAIKEWDVRSDEVTDGQTARFPLYYDTNDNSGNPVIKKGDSVFMSLQTIDSAVYEFYRTLQDTKDQNASALSNPITNIKGGAMGYFSAGAVNTKGTIAR